MKSGIRGLSKGCAPHLADVMNIVHEVWGEITEQQVKNCWEKTTLISNNEMAAAATTTVY